MGTEPKRVVAKPIPTSAKARVTKRELWARICFYYPQYTLLEASHLPIRDIKLLLKVARKIESERMYYLTQIATAPHTEKGKGVKELTEYFSKELK